MAVRERKRLQAERYETKWAAKKTAWQAEEKAEKLAKRKAALADQLADAVISEGLFVPSATAWTEIVALARQVKGRIQCSTF
jgi:electron transfer flavoprotein alpha subunit